MVGLRRKTKRKRKRKRPPPRPRDGPTSIRSSDVLAPTRTSGTAPPQRGCSRKHTKPKTFYSSTRSRRVWARRSFGAARVPLRPSRRTSRRSGAPSSAALVPCACSGTQKWVHVLPAPIAARLRARRARRASCAVCGGGTVPRRYARESAAHAFAVVSPRSPAASSCSARGGRWPPTRCSRRGRAAAGQPAQLAAVLAATEVRIWAQRSAAAQSRALPAGGSEENHRRALGALLAWLAVLGARSAETRSANPGGPAGIVDGLARGAARARARRLGADAAARRGHAAKFTKETEASLPRRVPPRQSIGRGFGRAHPRGRAARRARGAPRRRSRAERRVLRRALPAVPGRVAATEADGAKKELHFGFPGRFRRARRTLRDERSRTRVTLRYVRYACYVRYCDVFNMVTYALYHERSLSRLKRTRGRTRLRARDATGCL